jgi:hypothetical protein
MSKALDIALRAAEQQTEKEITSKFSARMQASLRDVGDIGTMRHTVITLVASENYQKAISEIEKYIESKSDFPQFQEKTRRYVQYAIDLINATKAKRSFPGLQYLAMSKQQELFDRAMDHFDDLKLTIKKVEKIEIKALIYCCFALLVLGFLIEVSRGVLPAASIVVDDLFGTLTNKLFDLIGF